MSLEKPDLREIMASWFEARGFKLYAGPGQIDAYSYIGYKPGRAALDVGARSYLNFRTSQYNDKILIEIHGQGKRITVDLREPGSIEKLDKYIEELK